MAYCIAGKVNSAGRLYLVIESVRPDTKHARYSNAPAHVDGAGGSPYRVDANALLNRPTAALRLKSLRGIAVVCLGADAGARHSVKTGENAALLNRR